MKKIMLWSLGLGLLTGCCSYTEIGRVSTPVKTDDGETPIASVSVENVAYSILGLIPLESGTVWKEGPYAKRPGWNGVFFRDRCTLDENLASLKAALAEIGSTRVANLVTESDSWRVWSLFLIKRSIIKTTCLVLEEKGGPNE